MSESESKTLLQNKEPPAVSTVAAVGDKVLPQNEDSEYDDVALGQIIKLNVNDEYKGTDYEKLEGLIYYCDKGVKLKIQVEVQPTILTELDYKEYEDDEGIYYNLDQDIYNKDTPYTIIKKAVFKEFVKINNFQVGQILYSFKTRIQGQSYLITDVDDKKDSISVQEIDKDTLDIIDSTKIEYNFNRIGIDLDAPFDVLRIHGLFEDLRKQKEDEQTALVEEPEFPKEEEIQSDELVEIDVPMIQGLVLRAGKDIPASDEGQRGDMITDLRRNPLPEWKGKTLNKDEYLRYVDTLMRLRNDIVEYNAAGESTKKIIPTTIDMLIQLIDSGFPLSRPVLDVKLNTYIDARPVQLKPIGETVRDTNLANEIKFNLLSEVIRNSLGVFDENVVTKEINVNEDPQFIRQLKTYMNQYFRVWEKNGVDDSRQKKIKEDTDFFRRIVPDFDDVEGDTVYVKESRLNGFPKLNMNNETRLLESFIGKVKFSIRRALKELKGRPAENLELINGRQMDTRGIITVVPADSAPVINHIIFPYLTTRSLGPIRSGKLMYDSYRAATCITLVQDLFLLLEGIRENPSADSIFLLKKEKETALQNIQISEYIKMILIGARGFEDYEDLFVSIGMNKWELNKDQFKAIQENIEFEYARRKEIIRKLREKSNQLAKQTIKVEKRPFEISESIQTIPENTTISTKDSILLQLVNQAFFKRELAQVSRKTPAYTNVDLALLAYALILSPDYVTAVICKNNFSIVKQANITLKKINLQLQREQEYLKLKNTIKGKEPQINACPHVKEYTMMKNTKDISKRMALLKKLYDTYHKGEKGNWYTCSSCSKPFMCKHEWLQINQFLNPNESRFLYKNLILNYSGGQFQGHYICKGCGQAISEIQYDDSVEFDDNGRPMIGYSPLEQNRLEDDPDGKEKEIDDFNGPSPDLDGGQSLKIIRPEEETVPLFKFTQYCGIEESKLTNITVLACIRNIAAFTYETYGVRPSRETFEMVCKRAYDKLLSQKSVIELSKDREFQALLKEELGGKDFVEKESKSEITLEEKTKTQKEVKINKNKLLYIQRYLNQRLIGYTVGLILVDIQTHLPPYEILPAISNCRVSIKGYPIIQDKNQNEAVEFLKCIVMSNLMVTSPWTSTGWVKLNKEARGRTISVVLMNCLDELSQEVYIKDMFAKREKWFEQTYGESSNREMLPISFLPVLYNPSKAPKEEINVTTATKEIQQQLLLEKAHRLANQYKDNTILLGKGSTMSCCYETIEKPGDFWINQDITWTGTSKPIGSKGTRLISPFVARPLSVINLSAPKNLYPRVFLKVCFEGDHIGLPHEPGYDNKCHFCGFDFEQDPATMENIDTQGKEALDKVEGLEINDTTFNELLDSVHNHLRVPVSKKPSIQKRNTILVNLNKLSIYSYTPEGSDERISWRRQTKTFVENEIKSETVIPTFEERAESLKSLQVTNSRHQAILADRYKTVSIEMCLKNDKKELKTGKQEKEEKEDKKSIDCISVLDSLTELPPEEIRNFLRTYFIVPLSRAVENQEDLTLEKVLNDYDLSIEHKTTVIDKILIPQSGPRTLFKNYFNDKSISNETREKRTVPANEFITNLKNIYNFLANFSVKALHLQSENNILYKILVKGMIFGAFFSYTSESTMTSFIRCCIAKYYLQGKKYTAEEVQRAIAEIAEKEKQRFIKETEGMSDQDKALDRLYRSLGIGKYAVGGTKAIWAYDKERWEKEAEERIKNGQLDWQEDPYSTTLAPMAKKPVEEGETIYAAGAMEDEN